MNSATASARVRNIGWFSTSLSNSSSWRWIIHSTFSPYLAVNLINFIFMHADVFNVLPESIDVTIGIKSSKVRCRFHWLFLWISSGICHVGPVWIVATANYRTLLLGSTGLSEMLVLGIFSGRSKRVRLIECSWWLQESSSLSWLLFNCSSGSMNWFCHTLWIRGGAVEVIDEFFSRHVVHTLRLVRGSNGLAECPIVGTDSTSLRRREAIHLHTLSTF